MSIMELGALGEFVGAIGVVITLGYLAYQIRQNTVQLERSTLAAKAAAVNASNIALRENRQAVLATSDVAEIFLKGGENPDELDAVEAFRWRLVMQNVTDSVLDVYTQALVTNFSPETWETQGVTLIERVLGSRGGRSFWAGFAETYPPAFRQEVERVLSVPTASETSGSR